MTVTTAYANTGGTGNRSGIVTLATTATLGGSGGIATLINGVTASGTAFFSAGQSKRTITVDFGTDKVVDEIKWYQQTTNTHGTWVVVGSNDQTNWNLLADAFTLGGVATQTITLTGNPDSYRYFKLHQINGVTSSAPTLYEIEFKLGTGGTVAADDATTPDYGNPGGMFDRTATVTATSAVTPSIGPASKLVDGSRANGEFLFGNGTSGHALTFDFGSGASKRVIEVKILHESISANHGSWKWQGSNNGTTFTDIGSAFTLGGALIQTDTTLAANAAGYRYYKLLQVSGTANNFYTNEIEFKIADSSGAAGTLAATEGADSLAASGLVATVGTLSAADGADSSAAAGVVRVAGSLAATDGADSAAFTGATASIGSLSAIEGADLAAATGFARDNISGTVAATDGADIAVFSGAGVAAGPLSGTDGADTVLVAGQVRATGTLAANDGADAAAVVGQTANSGTMAAVEGADAVLITGGQQLPSWTTIELGGTFAPIHGLVGTFIATRELAGRFAPVRALSGSFETVRDLDGTSEPLRALVGRLH